jgi:hypothetical protein
VARLRDFPRRNPIHPWMPEAKIYRFFQDE